MDRVNQAIQEATDLDEMMGRVLEITLELFECDRAWLVYPCDPKAPSWRVRIERARLEFAGAGAGALDCEFRHDPVGARHARCVAGHARTGRLRARRRTADPRGCAARVSASSRNSPWRSAPRPARRTLSGCINAGARASGPMTTGGCSRRSAGDSKTRCPASCAPRVCTSARASSALCAEPSPTSSGSRTSKGATCAAIRSSNACSASRRMERSARPTTNSSPMNSPTSIAPATGGRSRPAKSNWRNMRRRGLTAGSSRSRCSRRRCATRPARRSAWSGSPATFRSAARSTSSFASPPPRSRRRKASSSSTPTSGSCASTTPSSR